ncbi:ornithine cyclodeaminase family protein [Chachezhania antarctica]|uniref:ornithine cyclodeaminase family protein n=1 Tax=Chachezhania antarctica TaxID=2340860 RepID=UPI000EAB9101|nr:NAD(P)-binding domain-containing protein [Chachezhania antarctica]|tara:strand:- start:5802 stop:6713 length:912 start_codon:yes stop_codon:yes gene_type:complete
MTIPYIPFAEGEALLDWLGLCDALAAGHDLPKAQIGDTFLYRDPDTLLSRAAWIDGMGSLVKTATIFPGNPGNGQPMVNGGVSLYSDQDGTLDALVDFHLVTKWKTAGDSLLAARRLARPDATQILIVGAGTVGGSLIEAFGAGFPDATITLWNRTASSAETLAASYPGTMVATDLETAVGAADIIVTATMSSEPVIKGDWLRPGQHLNLIGAYRPDMRETDDTALTRSKIFVDSRDTTLDHIGELKIPLGTGAIQRGDVVADYYDLASFQPGDDETITLFKNGGGAHLDLMTARYILDRWKA